MRTGYVMFRDAMAWMGKHASRDMSTKIGGVMEPGKHDRAECIEVWDSGSYKDYIFRNTDCQEFKQRVYKDKHIYKLGSQYSLIIKAGFGDVEISNGADGSYRLLNKQGTCLLSSRKVGELYSYARTNGLNIIYNSIVWSKELVDDKFGLPSKENG